METVSNSITGSQQGIGARLRRKEDHRFLHGRGNYVSDMIMAGQSEVAFLRSPVAHGLLHGIRKPVGFETVVFTREDLVGVGPIVGRGAYPTYKTSEHHPLGCRKVRFVGEPVAMAFAPTRGEAEDILEGVELNIEELPPIIDALAARADTTLRVHDEWSDNLHLTLDMEKTLGSDKNFDSHAAKAKVIVKREMTMARQCMVPLEGKGLVAYWDHQADQLVVCSSNQNPHVILVGLAEVLGLDAGMIRVIAPDVGGGFGYKSVLHEEEVCVAWLALKYKRPFRYLEDRREHLVAAANARQHHYSLTGYADHRGRLLALEADITVDGGAYSNWPFTIGHEPGQANGNLPGPYDLHAYRVQTYGVATNKPGLCPYRGVSRTGVCFAIELMIDAIAREVGREPWEVRYENLIPGSAMPYDNIAGKHYDSGDFQQNLMLAKEKIDLEKWRERQRQGEPDGRRIGIGFATYTEQTAHGTSVFAKWGAAFVPGYEQAVAKIGLDGGLELAAGVHCHGQGMETTFGQIAHEVLGIDVSKIRVRLGDTATTPFSTGTYASRGVVMAGGAIMSACQALVPRLINIGCHLMQCATTTAYVKDGRVWGPQNSITFEEIAFAWYRRPDRLPPDVNTGGLEVTAGYRPNVDTGVFNFASHAVVVAVDVTLGHVEILDYVIVEDAGRIVNPMIVEGQTLGGAAQGIGTALYEESPYDANGQPLASTFADYILPGPTEVPSIRVFHTETPSPHTLFGAKGMGEGGTIAPPAAIFNAVNDAIKEFNAEVAETPLTPRRLLLALTAARTKRQMDGEDHQ
ncbi:MAG: xanthine dehydrogenase family protein molybdopterin-binding subunit [Ktedonobacteraceae bacterium]